MATSFLRGTEVATKNRHFFLRFRSRQECRQAAFNGKVMVRVTSQQLQG